MGEYENRRAREGGREGSNTLVFIEKSGSSRSSRGVLAALLLLCSPSSLLMPFPFKRDSRKINVYNLERTNTQTKK